MSRFFNSLLANATGFNADFQELITRYAWHDIWGRPGLDTTTRRLLVLGMTMGLARWEEFELHCRAAIRGGVPLAKIKETLMQGAIYCGVPSANTAFKLTMKVLREEGLVPPLQPLSGPARMATHHTFSQPQLKLALQGQASAGAPLVMSHAHGAGLHQWGGLAAQMADTHPVLRYDHRGHGGSAAPVGPATMDDLVDDAVRVVREWGRGPVVWVGLSMGGMVGQGLAVRHPELVHALVLVHDDEAGYAACGSAVASVDWLEQLRAVACQVLVIAGAQADGTSMALSQAMVERIAGAERVVLDVSALLSAGEPPVLFMQHLKRLLGRVAA